MKLSKSVLLSIALFGASASIFSYAETFTVSGETVDARGNHFRDLLARANTGDEIVFNEEVRLMQGTGLLNIPGITIKSSNKSRLHIEGYHLNLTGKAAFENLELSLKPARNLNETFAAFGNLGAEAKPSLIVTNGHGLTLDRVTTKVDGDNPNTRPIIFLGGGNSPEAEKLIITGSTVETKLYGISVDGKKSLNQDGGLVDNNDTINKTVTLDIGPNTNVLGGVSLTGNDDVNINSSSSTLSKINTGNVNKVNLSISGVGKNLGARGVLEINSGARFESVNLDGTSLTLENDVNISNLELKNESEFKLKQDVFNTAHRATITNLKSEGNNKLTLSENDSDGRGINTITVSSADIKSGKLEFEGNNSDLTFPETVTKDEDGNYIPPKEEESSTSETDGGPSDTGTSGPSNTNGTGPAAGGDQTGGEATVGDQAGGNGEDTGSDVDTEVDQDEENQGGTGTNTGDSSTPNVTGGSTSTITTPPGTPEVSNTEGDSKQDGTEESTDGDQSGKESDLTNGASEEGATAPSAEGTTTTSPNNTETDAGEKEGSAEDEVSSKPSEVNTEGGAPSTPVAQPANPSNTGNAANGGAPVAPTAQPVTPPTETPQAEPNGGNQVPPETEEGDQPTPVQPAVTDPKSPTTSETAVPEKTEDPDNDKGEDTDAPNKEDPAVTPSTTNNNGGAAGSVGDNNEANPSVKPGTPTTDDEPQGDDANGATADTAANNNAGATKPVTPPQPAEKPAEKPTEKPAEKPAKKPAETPKEKPAEKSIKDSIIDALRGVFSKKLTEKQQQQVAEKTEESLKDLTAMYTDYDFSFSLDALRVTEDRLNDLTMFNDLESASNDNYAFLAQSAKALKNHNSVWVSSSLAEQRGDGDSKRRLSTINLGYDRQFDNLILGGFVSYLRQKGERGELSSKLHGYSFSLYGKYYQNAHEVIALLNTGRTKAELQRNISALGVSNQADAKGKFIGLRVEYGYRMPFEAHNLQVKPLVGLNYNLGRQAAFTESGTMPVHVGKIKAQRLSVEAGVELRKYFETAYVYVKPTIQTDVMARSNDVDIRFVDTPNSIPFKSVAKKKTYFALSLGTQLQLRKNLLLDLSANSRMGKHERDIQGSIKLNYKF